MQPCTKPGVSKKLVCTTSVLTKLNRGARTLANIGKIHYDSGNYLQAAKYYEQATQMSPSDYDLWADLAGTYSHLNDSRTEETYLHAAKLVEQALEVNPKREELFSSLAHFYAGAREPARAVFWLAKTRLRRDVAGADEMAANAMTCGKLGRRDEALEWVRYAMQRDDVSGMLRRSSWLRGLQEDPLFLALIKR